LTARNIKAAEPFRVQPLLLCWGLAASPNPATRGFASGHHAFTAALALTLRALSDIGKESVWLKIAARRGGRERQMNRPLFDCAVCGLLIHPLNDFLNFRRP